VQYSSNRFLVQFNALKSFGKGFFLGPTFRYIDYSNMSQTKGSSEYPELTNGRSSLSFGIEELWDRRDNILTPSKGHFMNVGVDYNLGANKNETYSRLKIDLRYYKKLSPTLTWSNRLFMSHASKNTAFFDLPMAGGDQFVRGFRLGKYRDFSLQTLQTEFRSKVYKSIGLALFGGITSLKKDAFREMNQSLKWNTGIGLRIRMDKKEQTNLRFDYALGSNNNSGFYVAFGESF
jgi:outer membrane protein assembly factor BamA